MFDTFKIVTGESSGPVPVLRLQGRLEAEGAQQLRQHCQRMREQGQTDLVITLTDVSFVSSSGLGTFLLLTEEFQAGGGKIVFAAPSQTLMDAVSLLNLEQFLAIEDSVDEALAVATAR